jgi:chromosome segregation ATPase
MGDQVEIKGKKYDAPVFSGSPEGIEVRMFNSVIDISVGPGVSVAADDCFELVGRLYAELTICKEALKLASKQIQDLNSEVASLKWASDFKESEISDLRSKLESFPKPEDIGQLFAEQVNAATAHLVADRENACTDAKKAWNRVDELSVAVASLSDRLKASSDHVVALQDELMAADSKLKASPKKRGSHGRP